MSLIQNILPITTAKKELLKLIKKLQEEQSTFILTKDGKAAGVLLSPQEYEGLLETLDILSDEDTLVELKKSIEDVRNGKTYSFEDVFDK